MIFAAYVLSWIGYLIGPEEVIESAKKVHDFLTVGAAAPLQEAAVTGLNFPDSYYTELLETYTNQAIKEYDLAKIVGVWWLKFTLQKSWIKVYNIAVKNLDMEMFILWNENIKNCRIKKAHIFSRLYA